MVDFIKVIFTFGTLILFSHCTTTPENNFISQQEKVEEEICRCLSESYANYDVDLNAELEKFENYLITKKYLNDNSGKSYVQLFKSIEKDKEVLMNSSFKLEGLEKAPLKTFGQCFYIKKGTKELEGSDSKLKRLFAALDTFNIQQKFTPSNIASLTTAALEEDDFEKEIYRTYALWTLYFSGRLIADLQEEIFKSVVPQKEDTLSLNQ